MSLGATRSVHRTSTRLRAALENCKQRHIQSFSEKVYRIVYRDKYATEEHFCTGVGALLHGGRWNAKGHDVRCLYTACRVETAVAERLHYLKKIAASGRMSTLGQPPLPEQVWEDFVLGTIAVDIQILDINSVDVFGRINKQVRGFKRSHLIEEPGLGAEESLTQALGRVANTIGIQGLLVPSARDLGRNNLVIFPANVPSETSLSVLNIESVPLDVRRLS